jgi:hypothetical protein
MATAFVGVLAIAGQQPTRAAQATAQAPASCDLAAAERAQAEVQRLSALRRFNPSAVSIDSLREASLTMVTLAEVCYHEQYGSSVETIDDGGLTLGVDGAAAYNLFGTKWGSGSPYASTGPDNNGPRLPGGTVTYSFMASGVGGFEAEGGTPGTSLALGSFPTYQPCFVTEITNAFAAWSAVANIQFSPVADNGAVFNAAGAVGDIRIAGHVFDGGSGVLAHAYYPPPNGATAAGDLHFDSAENWQCSPGAGAIDIGVVAVHEIGHSIGLNHELRYSGAGPRTASMNPFYNPVIGVPLGDDINGAENIYGSAVGNSPDAIIDFGASYGIWVLNYGVGYTQLHPVSPEQTVTGDLDGNGIDEIIIDFGAAYGVYARMNNTSWVQLHALSPTRMATGDLDNSGRDDIVMDFTGYGVHQWMNNTSWTQMHVANASAFAIGNIDNSLGDDVVLTFPGYGVWRRMNNSSWVQLHVLDANQILIGDFDETTSSANDADDIVVNFAGYGIFLYANPGSTASPAFVHLHAVVAARMAAGDMNRDGRDELIVDFGPSYGIYVLNYTVGWTQLHSVSSEDLAAGDLDGNGQYEVIIDFGPSYGLYIRVNNASWVQAHSVSPEGLAVGDLN